MTRLFRLYGKKRGHRMSGWWLAGRVGEAFWFAAVFLLGVLSLSTMVAWQVFSPETHAYPVGYGFWLLILVSFSFIGIGAVGFIYRVLSVAYSDEHRTVLATQNLPNPQTFQDPNQSPLPPMVPNLQPFTDSPGVKLAFRLPSTRPEIRELVLGSIFVLAWDGLTAVVLAVALGRLLRGRTDGIISLVIGILFSLIAISVSRWFFIRFRFATGLEQRRWRSINCIGSRSSLSIAVGSIRSAVYEEIINCASMRRGCDLSFWN